MSTPLDRIKKIADRDGVSYADDVTLEELTARLYALPKHAAAKRDADALKPKPGDPVVWIGSGDDDRGNWYR
jgi:hypothetical protein